MTLPRACSGLALLALCVLHVRAALAADPQTPLATPSDALPTTSAPPAPATPETPATPATPEAPAPRTTTSATPGSFGDSFGQLADEANLTLRMYGDTGFAMRDNAYWRWVNATPNPGAYSPGVWNSFYAPRLDLFGSADVGKLTFLTEVMFEAANNQLTVDVERLQISYLFANWLRVRAGRTHVAWGYYNDTFHHGNFFELTTSRPYSVQFEDSGGIVLAHNVGAGIDGTFDLGKAGLVRYDAEIGNGRSADITSVALQFSEKNEKAVNVRLRWMPIDGLILGINGMRDVIPGLIATTAGIDNRPQTEELVGGAHVVYTENNFHVDIEGFAMLHNPDGAPSTSIYGGFAELGYSIGAFTPYVRPEYIRFPAGGDPVYQFGADSAQGTLSGFESLYAATRDFTDVRAGVKWMPLPQLALKLEGERIGHDVSHQEVANLKAAFGF